MYCLTHHISYIVYYINVRNILTSQQHHGCTLNIEGEVVAAGPGKLHPHTGVRITNPVTAGDSVLFGKFDGHDMNYNEEAVTMIRDDDILLHYKGVRMTMENVNPCRDYVLVELTKQKAETASGIVVVSKGAFFVVSLLIVCTRTHI